MQQTFVSCFVFCQHRSAQTEIDQSGAAAAAADQGECALVAADDEHADEQCGGRGVVRLGGHARRVRDQRRGREFEHCRRQGNTSAARRALAG